MILKGYEIKGYKWIYFENGLNVFTKRCEDYGSENYQKHSIIKVTDEDIKNGNINTMVRMGLTRV